MNDEKREALVQRHLEQARHTLNEARHMAEPGYERGCINRLYYACFYAAEGLLAAYGHSAKTHSGVKMLIGKHFVQTGRLNKSSARFFSVLFDARLEGDYNLFFEPTPDQIREWLPQAEAFVEEAAALLASERP